MTNVAWPKHYPNRVGSIRVVIVGGLAEMFAGAISMGLGAWLAAESDRKAYYVEQARERQEVEDCPDKEEEEIYEIFDQYHISREASRGVVEALKVNKDCWVQVSFSSNFHSRSRTND
jgi:VIT1/CCC1 family predicted Fe2+/Mn2+ transporter